VDEVGTIPPRMLQTAQITAGNSCNITNGSYSYDAQKRLLSYTINGLTYSYSAWDASGRPTTGVVTGGPTPVNESWSYNDAARSATLVQSTSAGFTTTTYLWDANGNPVTVVVVAGGTTSTSTTTTTGTAQVCK
jgi:YD repeat-containing protein